MRPRRRAKSPAFFVAAFVVLVLIAVLIQFVVHTYRTDPRDTRAIVERELRVNTLHPNEKIDEAVSVFQRPAIDYFRATRGLLVLTNQRLLYLGLQPRDLLASGDLPPTFEQRDFAIDTLVRLSPGRTFFKIAKAIVVTTPGGTVKFGVPSGAWPEADTLMQHLSGRYAAVYAEGRRQGLMRHQREVELRSVRIAAQRPVRYLVKPRDAVSTIATQWNTTPDRIRAWNSLVKDRIRAGQSLIVRQ